MCIVCLRIARRMFLSMCVRRLLFLLIISSMMVRCLRVVLIFIRRVRSISRMRPLLSEYYVSHYYEYASYSY